MANRYWVGGGSSTNWSATGNTNWGTASNTQDNASVPTSSDDVFFDGVGTGDSTCACTSNVYAKTLDFTGYTNTLTNGSYTYWNIYGNLTFSAGMSAPNIWRGDTFWRIRGGTCNLTTNGQKMSHLQIYTGATVILVIFAFTVLLVVAAEVVSPGAVE